MPKQSVAKYLAEAVARKDNRGLARVEPNTYAAGLEWLRARIEQNSPISFRQFYDEYLVPVCGTKYSHKGIMEYLRAHHPDEFKKAR